jgi:hypothetical protein
MASTWSSKLETRLSALADGASRESIQSLAQWIGFNRKHSKAFCTTLDSHLANNSAARQWLYFQIVNEVLLLEKENPAKWERLSETRIMMGESVLVPALQRSDKAMKDKVAPLIDDWDKCSVFGTPTLVDQLRKIVSSESTQQQVEETINSAKVEAVAPEKGAPKAAAATTTTTEEAKQVTTQVAKQEMTKDVTKGIADATKKEEKLEKGKGEESTSNLSMKPSASTEEVTFDFEGSVSFNVVSFSIVCVCEAS